MTAISCEELMQWQRNKAFTLLDVRLRSAREAQPLSIAGAQWRDPEQAATWLPSIPTCQPVVVFCAHGRSVSQGLDAQLKAAGFDSYFLEGGLAGWMEQGRVVVAE